MGNNSVRTTGVTFIQLLQVLFIGLKLTGSIDWPWLAVLAPIIIETVLALIVVTLVAIAGRS